MRQILKNSRENKTVAKSLKYSNSIFEQMTYLSLNIIAKFCIWFSNCARACGLGSQCRPNECIFGSGKPRRVGILGRGVYEPREGNGEVSLRATWEQGGRILSQQGGFQVS